MAGLGSAIAARRRTLSFSLGQVAARARVDRGYLGRVERGQRTPSLEILGRIAEVLGTTASALLNAAKPRSAS